jgi:hypothetical protein
MDEYIKMFGTIAAAFITATIGQTLAFFWTRRGATIKLRLKLDNSAQCLPISLQEDYGDGRGPKDRRFVRFKLFNHSPYGTVSEGSRVILHEITDLTNKKDISYPNPQPLLWNDEGKKGGHEEKDLPHGGPQYIDLLWVEDASPLRIVLKDNKYSNVGLTPGNTYRFKVQATAREAKSVTRAFKVKIGENYKDVRVTKWWEFWA